MGPSCRVWTPALVASGAHIGSGTHIGSRDMSDSTPPGWYTDPNGTTRWWDGTAWGAAAGEVPVAQPYQPTGQTGVPRLDAGEAFSYGWKKFQEHWQAFVVMVLVVGLISLVGGLIVFLALLPAMSGSSTGAAIGIVLSIAAVVLYMAINFVVQAGVLRAGLGVTKGVAPSLSMLTDTKNLGTYIGTTLLISLAAFVGFILCVLPGIAVIVFAAYAPFIALDRGVGPVEAIQQSYEMVKNNLGPVFLVLLLAYAVYYVGSLACYVGLLVSIPVALVMLAHSYRALTGDAVVA